VRSSLTVFPNFVTFLFKIGTRGFLLTYFVFWEPFLAKGAYATGETTSRIIANSLLWFLATATISTV